MTSVVAAIAAAAVVASPLSASASQASGPLAGAMRWRSIGPAISGGRTTAVAGSDRDPLLYYFGAADGGVWKTIDGGATWSDVWGDKPVGAIGAVTVAPSDDRVVWVGTGEHTFRNDVSYGDGVWVSADSGKTWAHRGLDGTFAISRILVSPADPDVALAGAAGNPYADSTERGVYRTTDGGKHWTRTLYAGPQSGVSDLAADPSGRVVFAGIWQFRRLPWTFTSGGRSDGLYRSRDGGKTWQRLRGHGLPAGLMGRIGVAVSHSDPHVVYALIQSKAGLLWRSDDGGDTWRLQSADTYVDQRPFYMSRLAVDPRDDTHILSLSEDLVESRDSGRTLTTVVTAFHQDHHDLWWSSDGRRLIEADDGGAPISADGGATWTFRLNVPIGQAYHIGYDTRNPYDVCGGFQDNDSFCGPSDSLDPLGILDSHWRDVGNDGDGSWAWPDPADPDLVWNVGVSAINGELGIYDAHTRENHNISPSLEDTNGAPLLGLPYRFDWQAPIAFSPAAPGTAYFGGNVVFETKDRGRTWTRISPDLTLDDPAHQHRAGGPITLDVSGAEFFDTILDIAPSPIDASVIWVGTDDGLIQVTRDGGAHWSRATISSIGPYGRVGAVEPSRFAPGSAVAVIDRHLLGDRHPYVFATTDFGATWRSLGAGLPSDQYAHVVRQSPNDPSVLYVGLEQGVWGSVDAGRHWAPLASGLPPASVVDLRIQPQSLDLIAATHGRSFYVLDDVSPLDGLAEAAKKKAYLFPPRPAYQFWRWWSNGYGTGAGECCVPLDRFAGQNPSPGASITYWLAARTKRAPSLELLDASGRVVRTIAGTDRAGINRVSWDLTETPPRAWTSAQSWNAGPTQGAAVVPGSYVVRLRAGDVTVDQPLAVRADPRSSWTRAELEARHEFDRGLMAEMDAIDSTLDELDARAAKRALNAGEKRLYAALTSSPRNAEDDLVIADRIRERLQTLMSTMDLSPGPPTTEQRAQAARIAAALAAALHGRGGRM